MVEGISTPAPRDRLPTVPAGSRLFVPITKGGGPGQIIEQVLDLLSSGALRPGDQLPPERDLATAVGASRSTTREALRVLQARGLLDIRVGARGGAFVAVPSSDRAAQGFVDLLRSRGVSAYDVAEARDVVEVAVLPLVCARATAADIADLRALNERDLAAHEEGRYEEVYSVEFHLRLAQCAHNPVVDAMLASVREVQLATLKITQRVHAFDRERGLLEHRLLVVAVQAGDADRAVSILHAHLHRTVERAPDPVKARSESGGR